MSEIKLSDEDIKRIAAEVIKTLTLSPTKPYIKVEPPVFPTWKPTPMPGIPHYGTPNFPYQTFNC